LETETILPASTPPSAKANRQPLRRERRAMHQGQRKPHDLLCGIGFDAATDQALIPKFLDGKAIALGHRARCASCGSAICFHV